MDGTHAIDWSTVSFTKPGGVPRVSDIISAASLHFGVSEADIRGHVRRRVFTIPRQVVMYLAREIPGMSFPKIAMQLGDIDHTSVLYGFRKIRDLIEHDAQGMRDHVDAVRQLAIMGSVAQAHERTIRQAAREAEARRAAASTEQQRRVVARVRHMQALADSGFIAANSHGRPIL